MNKLEKELLESIKKNLPQQVGDTLKARLEQADRDAEALRIEKESVVALKGEVATLSSTIEQYKQFDERNTLLESREKDLETKEKAVEVETLKYQLQSEKDKTVFSQSVAMGLVRNTEFRKIIFDSENPGGNPVIDGTGYAHYPSPTSKHYSETRTEE